MKNNSKRKPETFLELKSVQKNKIIKKAVTAANVEQKRVVDTALAMSE